MSIAIGNARTIRTISLYRVPLICHAAPQIGCGAGAKPALLALEADPHIDEAWLNHTGTMMAVELGTN